MNHYKLLDNEHGVSVAKHWHVAGRGICSLIALDL